MFTRGHQFNTRQRSTASTSSTSKLSGSKWAATAKASRTEKGSRLLLALYDLWALIWSAGLLDQFRLFGLFGRFGRAKSMALAQVVPDLGLLCTLPLQNSRYLWKGHLGQSQCQLEFMA